MTGQPGLACRSADGAAWIEIARPEALNALDNDTIVALTQALHRFGGDPAVRVIVLSARLSRSPSSWPPTWCARSSGRPSRSSRRSTARRPA